MKNSVYVFCDMWLVLYRWVTFDWRVLSQKTTLFPFFRRSYLGNRSTYTAENVHRIFFRRYLQVCQISSKSEGWLANHWLIWRDHHNYTCIFSQTTARAWRGYLVFIACCGKNGKGSAVSSLFDHSKRFTLYPLAALSIPTPTRLLLEAF